MGSAQMSAHAAQPAPGGAHWPGGAPQALRRQHAQSYDLFPGQPEGSGSATPSYGGGGGPAGMDASSLPYSYGGAAGDQSMASAEAAAAATTSGASPAAAQAEADAFHNAFGARLPRLAVAHAAGSSFGGGVSSGGGAPPSTDWGSGSPLRRVWAGSFHEAGGNTGSGGRPGLGPNSPSARAAGSPMAVRGTPTKHVAGSQGGSILSPRVGPLNAGSPGFAAASAQLAHLGLGSRQGSGSLGPSRHLRSSSSGGGIGPIAAACLSPQFAAGSSASGGGSASSAAASEQRRMALSSVSNLAQLRETVAADGALPPREKQNLLQLIEGAMAEQQQSQQQQRGGAAESSGSGSGETPHPSQAAGMTLQQHQQLMQHLRSHSTPSGPMSAPYGLARPQQQPSPQSRPAGPHRLSLDATSRAAAAAAAAATTAAGRMQSMSTPFGGAASVAATAAADGVGAAAGGSHPSELGLSGMCGSGALSIASSAAPSSGPVSGAPTPPGGAPPSAPGAPPGFSRHSSGLDTFRQHAASLGLPESGGSAGPGAGGILSGGGGYGSAASGVGLASSISAASGSRLRRCSGGMSPPPPPAAAFGEGPASAGGYMQGYPPQQQHPQHYLLQQQQQQPHHHQQQQPHEDQQQLLMDVYTAFAGGAAPHEEQQQQQPYPMRTSAGGGAAGLFAPARMDSAQSSRSLLNPPGGQRVVTSGGSGSGSGGTSSGGAVPQGMEGVVQQGGQAGDGAPPSTAADMAAGLRNAEGRAPSGSRSGSEGPRAPRPSRAAGSEGGSQVSSATGCSGDSGAGGPAAGLAAPQQSQQVPQLRASPLPRPGSAATTPEGPRSAVADSMLLEGMPNPGAPTAPPPEPAPTTAAQQQQPAMGADQAAALLQSPSPRSLPSPPWQAATPPRPASAMVGAASCNDLPRLLPQQQQQQQPLLPGAAAVSHGVTVTPLARQMLAMPLDVSGRSGPANSTGSGGGAGAGAGAGLVAVDVRARMLAGASMPALLPSYQQQQQQQRLQPRPPPNFASVSSGWAPELYGGDAVPRALGDGPSGRIARNDSALDFASALSHPHDPSRGGLQDTSQVPLPPLQMDSPQHRQLQQLQLQPSRFHRSHQSLLVGAASSTPGELQAAAAAHGGQAWRHAGTQAHAPYSDDGGFSLSTQSQPAHSAFGAPGAAGLAGARSGGELRGAAAAGPHAYITEPGFPQSPLPHHPASTPPNEFGFSSPHSRQQQQQQQLPQQQQHPSGYSTPTMQAAVAHMDGLQRPGASLNVYPGQQQLQLQQQERQWQVPRETQRAAAAAAAAAAQARAQAQVVGGFAGPRLVGSVEALGPMAPPLQALQEAMASAPGRLPVAAAADQDGDLLMLGGLATAGGDDGHTGLLRDVWNATGGAPAPRVAPGAGGAGSAAAGGPPRAAAAAAGSVSGAAAVLPPLPPLLPPLLEDGDVDALDCMLDELLGVGDMGDVVGPEAGGDADADAEMGHLHLHMSALQDAGGGAGRLAAARRVSSSCSGRPPQLSQGAAGAGEITGAGMGAGAQALPKAGGGAAAGLGGLGGSYGQLAARGSSELMGVVELGGGPDGGGDGGGGDGGILALGLGDGADTDMFMSGF
ncbi:hypothetical protein HXX76_015549 [Chlamydomonas incerta]|uniref:Uncharacterized protein n=1 Tax=Chlamydomonas incerta TaxID=51695 RepID=A0A835SGM3_CHLIN|nr:hypothetical protein HXX76_015549 [Chlamydomonas incerta]|eukprot:KAG2423033.1 hypothetical protein HXX76_015549 [Chlamydomonas incerta]